MLKNRHLYIIAAAGVLSLSGCLTSTPRDNAAYYNSTNYVNTPLYPEGYEQGGNYDKKPSKVVVPESYHVSALSSPIPPKDMDRGWIAHQNPQNYTIELADADNAAVVAHALAKAPKNERMAEVRYQKDGKSWYRGFYGSYPSYESAEVALQSLPEDLKQSAGIKTWSSVSRDS